MKENGQIRQNIKINKIKLGRVVTIKNVSN